MRLNWVETVAGVPMLTVRDCLKNTRRPVGRDYFAGFLGDAYDAQAFMSELVERGWLEVTEFEAVQNTVVGNAVAQAKKLKPMSRARAEELLNKVLGAVDEINASGHHSYRVVRLAVFGSYLSESSDLGDLDIAYELEAVWTTETADEVWQRTLQAFPPPHSADWVRRLGWPEEVVLSKIAVSKRVSLEAFSTIETYGWPHRILRDTSV